MRDIKSPYCIDILSRRRHSGSELVSNMTSIKVCRTQPVLEIHTHTHAAAQESMCPVQRRLSRSGGLQMFGVPQQLLELQWSVSPGGRGAEAQRRRNRMEHEATLKARGPQHLTLPTACEQTLNQHKSGWRGYMMMTNLNFIISRVQGSFCIGTGLFGNVQYGRTRGSEEKEGSHIEPCVCP